MFYFCKKLENGTSILNTHTHTHTHTHIFQNDRETVNSGNLWEWNQMKSERCLFLSSQFPFLIGFIFNLNKYLI